MRQPRNSNRAGILKAEPLKKVKPVRENPTLQKTVVTIPNAVTVNTDLQDKEANTLINNYSILSGVNGALAIPLADQVVLVSLLIDMIHKLSAIYQVPNEKTAELRTVITGLVTSYLKQYFGSSPFIYYGLGFFYKWLLAPAAYAGLIKYFGSQYQQQFRAAYINKLTT